MEETNETDPSAVISSDEDQSTAASKATSEERTTSSDIRMLGSSLLASALLSEALNLATASQVQAMRHMAAASQPIRIAACQLVKADTIAPTATPIDAVIATRIPAGELRRRSDADIPGLTNKS